MPLEAARTARKQPEPFEIAAVLVVQRIVGTANAENVVEDQDGFQQLSGSRPLRATVSQQLMQR